MSRVAAVGHVPLLEIGGVVLRSGHVMMLDEEGAVGVDGLVRPEARALMQDAVAA